MKIEKSTRILITGAGGMLGAAFYQHYNPIATVWATDIDLNEPWLQKMDVREKEQIKSKVEEFKPDIIFHLAALTDLEYCETHPDHAYLTNTIGTENITNICKENGIPMLYISTAGIFDGNKEHYDDWDMPNPINHYGRSKWAGEDYVKSHLSKHFVCRAGWMMGGGPKKDKKFINKIMKQIQAGKTFLNVVNDKLGTPTYTHDFAANSQVLIESGNYGIYNMVCEGDCSRHDVAVELIRIIGKSQEIKVNIVDSDFWKEVYFAPRPSSEKLEPKKLKLRNIYIMKNWKEALHDYLTQRFNSVPNLKED